MIVLIGFVSAVLLYILIGPPLSFKKRNTTADIIDKAYEVGDESQTQAALNKKSLEYQLDAAGVNLKPATFRALNIAAAIGTLVIMWLFLPGIPAIACAVVVYIGPRAWLSDKVKNRGFEIDKLLPIVLSRIANMLATGASIPDAFDTAAALLDHEGKNPLAPELRFTASEMRSKDNYEALQSLARRSPSLSLGNMAYLLQGYLTSGGEKYNQVMIQSANRLRKVINARNQAHAKAGESMTTAKAIPAMLLFVLISLSSDATVRQSLKAFIVQAVLGVAIACMVAGYFVIKSIVDDAV